MKVTVDLTVLVDFLSHVLGENTEIALHKLDDISSSLIDIRNGHITGRKAGMPLTDFALEMIKDFPKQDASSYKINYLSLAKGGQKLRSSSLLLCDEKNQPAAMLCLNHDDTDVCNMIRQLRKMITINDNTDVKEDFCANVKEINEQIIQDVIAKCPTPIARLSVEDKISLVSELSEKGVFLMKGSIEIVSNTLSISEPTLYRYLKQINV